MNYTDDVVIHQPGSLDTEWEQKTEYGATITHEGRAYDVRFDGEAWVSLAINKRIGINKTEALAFIVGGGVEQVAIDAAAAIAKAEADALAVKKAEKEEIVQASAEAVTKAFAPLFEMLAKGQATLIEGQAKMAEDLAADVESTPVRDETTKRIEKTIHRRVKGGGVQPIPETKLPTGTGPTVAS